MSRYNGDKDSFELFNLRAFIDNINNERFKNKKDAREEFKTVKKNVKSEALKQIVKELEQAIYGYDDDKDKEELEETEELDRRFKNLISKKCFKSLKEAEELDKRFKNLISKKRLEAFKEYSKKAEYIDPQIRVNELRKKLNNLPETSSDETSDEKSDKTSDETSDDNNNDNDNDDSEDNQISNFVDRVLKKVSKETVNDDNKNDDNKNNADLKKMKAFKNLSNEQVRDAKKTLELIKKYSELNTKSIAETDKQTEEIIANNKAKEEASKNIDKVIKEYYTKEAQRVSKEIEKFNKMINGNLNMSSEKSEIINKLIELYSLIQIYYLNKMDNNLKANKNIDNISIGSEIRELEKRLRDLPKKGSGVFTSQKEFAKLLTFLAQLLTNNSSKEPINDIKQLINNLYDNKQITKQVYNVLNKIYK